MVENESFMPSGGILDGLTEADTSDSMNWLMPNLSTDVAAADTPAQPPVKPASDPVGDLMHGISTAEGTDDAAVARSNGKFDSGYDVTYQNNRFGTPSKPVSQMTLDEVHQYQQQMLADPDNKAHSSAVGKYQIVGRTMRGLQREMGLDGSEVFSPELQDRMARRLIEENGLKAYQAGKINPQQFQDGLAKQWDSIGTASTGNTLHGGRLGMTSDQVQGYISRIPQNK